MIPLARVMLTASLGALALASCASDNDAATVEPAEPEVSVADVRAGGTIVPGEAVQFGLNTHCGVKVLGKLNGTSWIADEPGSDAYDWMPEGWEIDPNRPDGPLTATLILSPDEAMITATHRGRSVVYRPEARSLTELGLLCD